MLFAAGIGRFAALLDLLVRLDRFHEPDVARIVEDVIRTGVFRGFAAGLFTTAYFHRPGDLLAELGQAGFIDNLLFNIEGLGYLVGDFEDRWADAARREALLRAARLVEEDPDMMGAAGHLLAIGRRPAR